MVSYQRSLLTKTLALTIPMVSMLGLYTPTITAQTIPEIWSSSNYKPPAGIGRPSGTEGGATRGTEFDEMLLNDRKRLIRDEDNNAQLIALVPNNQYGVTLRSYPDLFVYIGSFTQEPDESLYVEFSLTDNSNEEVYFSAFQTQAQNEVIKLDLPTQSGLMPLAMEQPYGWSFKVYDANNLQENYQVGGVIMRVPMTDDLVFDMTTDWTIAKSYAESEIWYDAIATLANTYSQNNLDEGIESDLNNLLRSVNLDISVESFPSETPTASNF